MLYEDSFQTQLTLKRAFRIRNLDGTLLVIKGINDCITIERGKNNIHYISYIEGEWSENEKKAALMCWNESEAQQR